MGKPEQPSWTSKQGWERGDDAEKEVRRQEAATGPASETEVSRNSHSAEELQKDYERFYDGLKRKGRIVEVFEVDPAGNVSLDLSRDNDVPSLWILASPSGDLYEGGTAAHLKYTTEDLMTAAQRIKAVFPAIDFSFKDERPRRFSYTATISGTN